MATTINQLANDRRKAFVEIKRELRQAEIAVQQGLRLARRVTSRREKVPEARDLQKIVELVSDIEKWGDTITSTIETVMFLFGAI